MDVSILTQISMHVSIILATVPCIRPWLIAFESGGLKAPADIRRASRHPVKAPGLAPLLPIALPPMTLDDPVASIPGNAGHRKRVEAWPVQMWASQKANQRATITTIEHDPADAKEAARKRSHDSANSRGITRTNSFSVDFEDIEQFGQQPSEPPLGKSITRTISHQPDLEDVGELMGDLPKAKCRQRIGSAASI